MKLTHSSSRWPLAITIGLAGAIGINLVMVRIALTHRSVIEADDPAYDLEAEAREVRERQRSQSLGWNVTIMPPAQRIGDGRRSITLEVTDHESKPIEGLEGFITATRADDASLDRSGSMRRAGDGSYGVDLTFAKAGLYRLSIELRAGSQRWVQERDLWVERW